MKHLIYILLMLAIFSGCKTETDAGMFGFDKEITLKKDRVYHSPSDILSVKVLKIYDSRCPIGVECFWAGLVTVHFEVKEAETFELILNSLNHQADTVNNYVFRLIDVLPYPRYQVEVPDSEKKVILQISRL